MKVGKAVGDLVTSFLDSVFVKIKLRNDYETTGKIVKMEKKYRYNRVEHVFEICNPETPNFRFHFCLSELLSTELIESE